MKGVHLQKKKQKQKKKNPDSCQSNAIMGESFAYIIYQYQEN